VLPGEPALYVTEQAVFMGPSQQDHLLDPARENRIPAPALEHAEGVAFLQSLGVELPPRIRERLRLLPYQVAIDCQLKRLYPESNAEECIFSVVAEAPDGHRQTWTGYNWLHSGSQASRGKKSVSDSITVYDWASLRPVPALLEPLGLKPSSYGAGLAMRVTKKFSALFAAWLRTVPPHFILRLGGELESLATPDVAGHVKLDVTEAEID